MFNQKFNKDKSVFFALAVALILSFIPIVLVGGDYWAESFAEYFDTIKGFESIFNVGWGGYYSFFPQFVAAVHHDYLSGLIAPWYSARIFSSVVIFITAYLSLQAVLSLDKTIKWYIGILISLALLLQVLHPAVNSMISIGYFLYLPLIMSMLTSSIEEGETYDCSLVQKTLFLLALLTKPSLLFIAVFFGVRRAYFFKILCLCIFVFQYYLTKTQVGALSVTLELNSDYLIFLLKSVFSIIGLIVNHLFLFDVVINDLFFVGFFASIFFCIFLFKFVSDLRISLLLLSVSFGAIIPFVFLVLFLKSKGYSYDLSLLVLSLAKAQYWIILAIVIPFVCIISLYKVKKKTVLIVFITIAISNLVYLNVQKIAQSSSSNVNTGSMIANQIPESGYWRCFPVIPLPGFPIDELKGVFLGDDNQRLDVWRSGGCKIEMNFTHFGKLGFNNNSKLPINTLISRGSHSYLIMLTSKNNFPIEMNKIEQCYDIYGTNSVITKAKSVGSFDYITGWSDSKPDTKNPNLLRSFLGECFNLELDSREANVIVFYPDKK